MLARWCSSSGSPRERALLDSEVALALRVRCAKYRMYMYHSSPATLQSTPPFPKPIVSHLYLVYCVENDEASGYYTPMDHDQLLFDLKHAPSVKLLKRDNAPLIISSCIEFSSAIRSSVCHSASWLSG